MPEEEKESDKFLFISLEDEKSNAVAGVLSLKACKLHLRSQKDGNL